MLGASSAIAAPTVSVGEEDGDQESGVPLPLEEESLAPWVFPVPHLYLQSLSRSPGQRTLMFSFLSCFLVRRGPGNRREGLRVDFNPPPSL